MELKFRIDSKYGTLELTPTEETHIYVELGRSSETKIGNETTVMLGYCVRGVAYSGGLHMYRHSDLNWHLGPEFKEDRGEVRPITSYEARQHAWIKRCDWLKRDINHDGPSDSARNAMIENITKVVNEWAKNNEYALFIAHCKHLESVIDSARDTEVEAWGNLQLAADKLEKLEADYQYHMKHCPI